MSNNHKPRKPSKNKLHNKKKLTLLGQIRACSISKIIGIKFKDAKKLILSGAMK